MIAGTVVADRSRRLFVVLASDGDRHAVARVRIGRVRGDKEYAGDTAVTICGLSEAVVMCGSTEITRGDFTSALVSLDGDDLARCQRAARLTAEERVATGVRMRSEYAQSAPSFRSGGRRVGTQPGA